MSLFLALLLDGIFGEPRALWSRLPHPAVLMGRCVGWIDATFNKGKARRIAGALSFGGLVVGFYILGMLLAAIPGIWVDVIVGAMLLAQRSLVDHVRAVASGLRMSLAQGRRSVGMIVSRDTSDMNQSAVARSAIESGAENLSDGVIAPAFWFAVLGLPGLLAYKITNTADSMIGYRTARHEDFGWAAAKFDDLLNWVPARLTALMIWFTDRQSALAAISHDAGLHRSPNAGWPEAAMAHKLDIALAGPRSYEGMLTLYPYVNPNGRIDLGPVEVEATTRNLWHVWGIALFVAFVVALV